MAFWFTSILAIFLLLFFTFIFFVLSLPPLHNGHKSGAPPQDDVRDYAVAGRRLIFYTGLSIALERALNAANLIPFVLRVRTPDGAVFFPTQAEADALFLAGVPDGVEGTAFNFPFVITSAAMDLGLTALVYSTLVNSITTPTRRYTNRFIVGATSITIVGASSFFVHRLMVLSHPGIAGGFILTAALAVTLWFIFILFFLARTWSRECQAAEHARLANSEAFQDDSRWVDHTTRSRLAGTLFMIIVALGIFQIFIGFFIIFPRDTPTARVTSAVVDALSLLLRAMITPIAFFFVGITSIANAKAAFQTFATAFEHRTRLDAQKIITRYVCHEVRVPLGSFSLGLDLLAGVIKTTDSRVRRQGCLLSRDEILECDELLSNMVAGASSMSRILNDVLQVEAMEQGKITLVYEPFHPRVLISRVCNLFAPTAQGKRITLATNMHIAPDVPQNIHVLGDADRLLQVCSNFLSNALKFTEGGKQITVSVSVCAQTHTTRSEAHSVTGSSSVRPSASQHLPELSAASLDDARRVPSQELSPSLVDLHDKDGPRVVVDFRVKDEGAGISQQDAQLLFKPFSQLKSGAKFKENSSGLGLSISHGIITMHEGEIGVESDGPGKGSTFFFSVPLRPAPTPGADSSSTASESGTLPPLPHDAHDHDQSVSSVPLIQMTGPSSRQLPPLSQDQPRTTLESPRSFPRMAFGTGSGTINASASLHSPSYMEGSLGNDRGHGGREVPRSNATRHASSQLLRDGPVWHTRRDSAPKERSPAQRAELHVASRDSAPHPVCLVVDDVATNANLLRRGLQRIGYTNVHVAKNGREAVEKAGHLLQDEAGACGRLRLLVFMDDHMPELSGPEATDTILRTSPSGSVIVIGVTGSHPSEHVRFTNVGATSVLLKPVSLNDLRKTLAGIQAEDSASVSASPAPPHRPVLTADRTGSA